MISVAVTYRAKPDAADELAIALADYAEMVRAEPGCMVFEASRAVEDDAVFHLYEVYASQEALEAHTSSPHYQEYVPTRFMPLLIDRVVSLGVPVGE